MLYRRIATVFSFVVVFITVVFLLPLWLFATVVAVAIGIALWELYRMTDQGEMQRFRWLGILFGAAFPLLRCFDCAGVQAGQGTVSPSLGGAADMGLFLLIMVTLIVQGFSQSLEGTVSKVGATCWAALYVGWLFSFVVPLRCMPSGKVMVTMLFAISKVNDMAAYLVGTQFGRHKFSPRLSPNKTWEGAIGGMAGSLLASLFVWPFLRMTLVEMTWIHALGLGVIIGVLAPIGDLCESLIKRSVGCKDSSRVLFGTGGLLDGMDSLLFCVPAFYFTMNWRGAEWTGEAGKALAWLFSGPLGP